MTAFTIRAVLLCVTAFAATRLRAAELELLVRDVPAHGVVLGEVTIPPSYLPAKGQRPGRSQPAAEARLAGRPVPVQLIRPVDGGPGKVLIALKLPAARDCRIRLALTSRSRPKSPTASMTVRCGGATITHRAGTMGALPSRIAFGPGGKVFERFAWNDRLYDPEVGGLSLRHDPTARFEVISAGPVCTVVRTHGRYVKADRTPGDSQPTATYDWMYFRDLPLAYVRAEIRQRRPRSWREIHVLELNYPDDSFPSWAGGAPARAGTFKGKGQNVSFSAWGLVRDKTAAVGMLRAGRVLLHDGRGAYGTYIHAHATKAWAGWADRRRSVSAWLWLGKARGAAADVAGVAAAVPTDARVVVTLPGLRAKIAAARDRAAGTSDPAQRRAGLVAATLAEALEARGEWALAGKLLAGHTPATWTTLIAGDMAVTVERIPGGLTCRGILDLEAGVSLTAARPAGLFAVTLRHVKTGRLATLTADSGWGQVHVKPTRDRLALTWARPGEKALSGVRVSAVATAPAGRSGVDWSLAVANPHEDWGVWRVAFPRVSLGPFAPNVHVLIPQAAGVVKKNIWRAPVGYRGSYPSGWTSMQYMAAYASAGTTGLYVAMHDPDAWTKDIIARSDTQRRHLLLAFDHPVPNMGQPRTGFALNGTAAWRLLRGNWFDASVVYRNWVRAKATWWPALAPEGRADTPRWMRELNVWGLLGGGADGAVAGGTRFAQVMDMPVGFHWYNWHRIPFDNDYPHYFPPKDGFTRAVARLQGMARRPAYVMPYINGRLWDTRDRGATDFQFTRLARPAATKDIAGKVHTETYGSKESDGSRVVLAAMCPATTLWQDRVRRIVLGLMKDHGTRAVYIDQVAAARPRLCFDRSHGHPVGGGGWWVAAYGRMLTDLRKAMGPDRALTTECNAEPYLKWFDGYLTWHWQYDGQVPAFAAVYGGAIQMFGRAYRGGPTRDLALRMKAAQQLVFGEQIGWISAGVAKEKANADFLRNIARLRGRLVRFFHAGRMARPPTFTTALPTITADWQWRGVWPVTTPAVLSGAWELPREKKLAMIFVNASDKPVTADLPFDAERYGLGSGRVTVVTLGPNAAGQPAGEPGKFIRRLTMAPEAATALVITAVEANR